MGHLAASLCVSFASIWQFWQVVLELDESQSMCEHTSVVRLCAGSPLPVAVCREVTLLSESDALKTLALWSVMLSTLPPRLSSSSPDPKHCCWLTAPSAIPAVVSGGMCAEVAHEGRR